MKFGMSREDVPEHVQLARRRAFASASMSSMVSVVHCQLVKSLEILQTDLTLSSLL